MAFLETRVRSLLREFRFKGGVLHLHCAGRTRMPPRSTSRGRWGPLPLRVVPYRSAGLEAIYKIAHVVKGKLIACGA
jgi:hypothetical protein